MKGPEAEKRRSKMEVRPHFRRRNVRGHREHKALHCSCSSLSSKPHSHYRMTSGRVYPEEQERCVGHTVACTECSWGFGLQQVSQQFCYQTWPLLMGWGQGNEHKKLHSRFTWRVCNQQDLNTFCCARVKFCIKCYSRQ